MTVYIAPIVATSDAKVIASNATYSVARSSTAATTTPTATSQVGQSFFSGYNVDQYFITFNTAAIPAGAAVVLNLNVTTAGTATTDNLEVRVAPSSANKIDGNNLATTTPLLGSAVVPTVTGRFNVTLDTTLLPRASSVVLVIHSRGERLNTAPTGTGDLIIVSTVAATAGLQPQLSVAGPWSFVGVSSVVETATTALTLTEPSGVAAGDLLVACISGRGYNAGAAWCGVPAGWNLVGSVGNASTLTTTSALANGFMCFTVRGASAPSYAFTLAGTASVAQGSVVAYRNPTTSPSTIVVDISGAGTTAVNTTAVSLAALTTTADDDLIVALAAGGQEATWSGFNNVTTPLTASGATDTASSPSGFAWTERVDANTVTGADTSIGIFDAVRTTAGATGNLTVTASQGAGHVIISGAFKFTAAPPTLIVNASPGSLTSPVTTASFTPVTGTQLIVFGTTAANAAMTIKPTISDSVGYTWTEIGNNKTSSFSNPDLWVVGWISSVVPSSPASMTVTVTQSGANALTASVMSVPGGDTNGFVVQAAYGEDLAAGDPTFTFGATPNPTNLVIGCNWHGGGNSIAKPTTYTNLFDVTPTNITARRVEVFYDNTSAAGGAQQSISTNLRSIVMAVELGIGASGAVTVNVTGNSATTSVGTVSVTTEKNISTTAATNLATASVGDVTVTVLSPDVSVGATTNLATASVGNVTVTAIKNASTTVATNLATASVGNVSVAAAINITTTATTNLATVSVGTVTVAAIKNVSTTVTTNLATTSVGTVSVTTSRNVSTTLLGLSINGLANSVTVSAGGALWTPAELGTDLIAWYDFADAATVIQSSGFLTQWSDKSGNARHAIPMATNVMAINSDGIYIANATSGSNLAIAMPTLPSAYFDFAFAGKPNPAGSYRTLIAQQAGGQHHILIETGTNNLGTYAAAFFQPGSLTWPSVDGQAYFVGPNATGIKIGRDGAAPIDEVGENFVPDATPYLLNYSVTGGQGWGTAREFVFMTASMSQTVQDKVSGYLAWKWDGFLGVTTHVTALPSGHPYKGAPPPSSGATNVTVNVTGNAATASVGTVSVTAVKNVTVPLNTFFDVIESYYGFVTVTGGASTTATTNLVTASVGNVSVTAGVSVSTTAATNLATTSVGTASVTAVKNISTTAVTNQVATSVGNVTVATVQNASVNATTNLISAFAGGVSISAGGSISFTASGSQADTAVGNVTVNAAQNISTTAATNLVTASVGNVSVATVWNASTTAATNLVTTSVGNVSVTAAAGVTVNALGSAATASVGNVSVSTRVDALVNVIGQSVTASVGNVGISFPVIVNVTGSSATASVKNVAVAIAPIINQIGAQATASVGTVTVTAIRNVSVAVTGQGLFTSTDFGYVDTTITVAVTGTAMTARVGTAIGSIPVGVAVNGSQMTASTKHVNFKFSATVFPVTAPLTVYLGLAISPNWGTGDKGRQEGWTEVSDTIGNIWNPAVGTRKEEWIKVNRGGNSWTPVPRDTPNEWNH